MKETVDCPDCGCPNRPADKFCSYCRKELPMAKSGGNSWIDFIRSIPLYLKFRFKLGSSPKDILNGKAATFIVGLLLFSFGLLLLAYAVLNSAGFLYISVGTLLLLYGGFALKEFFKK